MQQECDFPGPEVFCPDLVERISDCESKDYGCFSTILPRLQVGDCIFDF
jgi:hypothetical protein